MKKNFKVEINMNETGGVSIDMVGEGMNYFERVGALNYALDTMRSDYQESVIREDFNSKEERDLVRDSNHPIAPPKFDA